MLEIKVKPSLYDLTNKALTRFNSNDRNCIAEGEIKLDTEMFGGEYSQVNCFVAAAYEQVASECGNQVDYKDRTYQTCFLHKMKQIGRWKSVKGSDKKCLPSCKRFQHYNQNIFKNIFTDRKTNLS